MAKIQLLLEDYIANLRIGVLDKERTAPQRVRVNVSVKLKKPPTRDHISKTYDYTKIIAAVDTLAARHFDLLETFAGALAKKLLSDKKITGGEIELMKLDIIQVGRVGARYRFGK